MESQNADHDRFVAYYHDHKDKLFTYLMYRLNFDRMLAEDLLMDIVLKAYENFSKFDPEKGSFKTWIFTLAHNHLVNFWRDNKKKKTVSLENLEEEGAFVAVTEVDDPVSQEIESKQIQHILSLMKDEEQEIIALRYLEELSYKEIAQITGKNEGAIRTSLSRALDHFSDLYQKFYPTQ